MATFSELHGMPGSMRMRLTAIASSNRKTGRRLSECSPAEGIHGCQTKGDFGTSR
jgi:hypothetical protein